jgi:S-adenosylmethionine:tRNA ribosyltransferase-isomerase
VKTSDFDYELPESAVAQQPAKPRDACRLAVLDRASGRVEHAMFSDIGRFLRPGDCLVLNDSKVLASRVSCIREPGTAKVQALLLRPDPADPRVWEALLKPARRVKGGQFLCAVQGDGKEGFVLRSKTEAGTAWLEWRGEVPLDEGKLAALGLPPLPPYIRRQEILAEDREDYQTVFARWPGSAAAPTAGLHFTPSLLERLQRQGIGLAKVTLHVGLGTFLAVKEEDPALHHMHQEDYEVSAEAFEALRQARKKGGRIVAVGTTSLRVLESAADAAGDPGAGRGSTRLYIRPGYRFRATDALVTNFHVPRSTLLMLVSALDSRERILALYQECLNRGYRFLSYGDAMMVL